MRSTGFKTDTIPPPARAPPPNPRGLSAREQLSRLAMSLAGGLGLREGAPCGLAKPLRQVFPLVFARRRARVLFATGGLGSPKELSPRKAQAAALRSEARRERKKKKKNTLKKKREEEEEMAKKKKSQAETYWERLLLATEEVAPNPAEPRSLVAEEAPPPPRCPALLLHTLGREGGSQFARSAAALSSLLPPPSPSLLQPFTTFLPETRS